MTKEYWPLYFELKQIQTWPSIPRTPTLRHEDKEKATKSQEGHGEASRPILDSQRKTSVSIAPSISCFLCISRDTCPEYLVFLLDGCSTTYRARTFARQKKGNRISVPAQPHRPQRQGTSTTLFSRSSNRQ